MKPITLVLVAKSILIGMVGVGLVAASRGALGNEQELAAAEGSKASANGKGKDAPPARAESPVVPPLPRDIATASEAERIRANLELLRKDAELKTKALVEARQAYERTRRTVEQRLKEVKEQKALLDDTLQKEKETKAERLKEALVFVEKMEPRKAAPVVETMDRDLVIALFKRLPPRVVTRILENVNPRRATELMEYYTRIRSGREFALLRELGLCREEGEDSEGSKPSGGANGGATGEAPTSAPPESGATGTAAPAAGAAPAATPAGGPGNETGTSG